MKTPEVMAEEWANNRCPEQGPEFIVWCMCKEDFLAGYQAALPKWISVKERLPKMKQRVLTYDKYSKDINVAWRDDCDEFLRMYDWVNEYGVLNSITHWMPFSEPPKESQQ
jgi:hypothetical protein